MSNIKIFPRIKQVRAYTVKSPQGKSDQGADCHDVDDDHWINGQPTPIATPMSIYPQYSATRFVYYNEILKHQCNYIEVITF